MESDKKTLKTVRGELPSPIRNNTMNEDKRYVTVKDVQDILGISKSKAYGIIRDLNEELKKKGYLVVRGKTSRAYFEHKTLVTV